MAESPISLPSGVTLLSPVAPPPSAPAAAPSPPPTTTNQPAADGTSRLPETSPEGSLLTAKPEAKPGDKVVPDKYEFKAPEGYEFDEKVIGEASTIFKELGLPQEAAQRLVDFYVKSSEQAAQAPFDAWKGLQEQWISEVKADPEIGGKLDLVKSTTSKAIDTVLGPALAPEFRKAMDLTGAGNNPAFIRAFYKMAQALTEGTHVPGHNPSPEGQRSKAGNQTWAHALYPNLP